MQLSALLDAMGHHMAVDQVRVMLEGVDVDHDGKINYVEFMAATIDSNEFLHEDELHDVFQRLDQEKTGELSKEDLELALSTCGGKDGGKEGGGGVAVGERVRCGGRGSGSGSGAVIGG